jgi:hypothetical protein
MEPLKNPTRFAGHCFDRKQMVAGIRILDGDSMLSRLALNRILPALAG